jgi:hypothetical protein
MRFLTLVPHGDDPDRTLGNAKAASGAFARIDSRFSHVDGDRSNLADRRARPTSKASCSVDEGLQHFARAMAEA